MGERIWGDLFALAAGVIILVILLRDNVQANALLSGGAGTYTDTVSRLSSLG